VAQRSLFSILTEQHWAVSLLVAGAVYLIGAAFSPLIGAAASLPFVVVAGYVGWKRLRSGPTLDIPALLKALRGAAPEEMRAMLADVYGRQGYQISDAADGDLKLERNGYVTLVRFRRWRAQSTAASAVTELQATMRKAKADHGVYITAGTVADTARKQAAETDITLIDGPALAMLVGRTSGARKTLARSIEAAAKA